MSNLISQNYRAGEKLHQGQIVAIDTDSAVYDPHVIGAKSGDDIIGICKNDCEINDLAVVYSIVPGQYQPVFVADDVIAGDRLCITSDGDVVAYDGSQEGVEQLPLVAMGKGSGSLIDAVGCRLATGAVDGDLEVDGDLNVNGDVSVGTATITEDDITFYDNGQQKSIAFKDLAEGGMTITSLYATDTDGIPAVGSFGLYQVTGLSSTDIKYGAEFTSDGSNVIVANLGVDGNNMVKESGGNSRKKLPNGAKIAALNCFFSCSGLNKAFILGIRIA